MYCAKLKNYEQKHYFLKPMIDQNQLEKTFDPVIEVWRFIAACAVMAWHYRSILTNEPSYWELSATGVDLFFVLSGYVFAPTLINGIRFYPAFLLRRFFRMYPLYVLAILLYACLPNKDLTSQAIITHLLMLQTSIDVTLIYLYNPAFWSLPPEWAFYCLMPLLIIFLRWQGVFIFLLFAFTLRVALGFFVEPPGSHTVNLTWANWAVVNLPGILSEFLIGVMIFRIRDCATLRNFQMPILVTFLSILCFCIWLYGKFILGQSPKPELGNLVGLIAALIYGVALWLSFPIRSFMRDRSTKFAMYVGALSYGLYLFHNASPQWLGQITITFSPWATIIFSILATLSLTLCAHYWIEKPLRSYGRRISEKIMAYQKRSRSDVG